MATGRTRRKTAYRKKVQNRFSMFLVLVVVVLILIVVAVQRVELGKTLEANQEKIDSLNEQIAEEEAEAERIKEYAKYVTTDAFRIQVAHDKLGLVFPDEIIFKEED